MNHLLDGAIVATFACYAVAMLLGLWRLLRGPGAQDRVLAIDFLYVNGMLIALLLGLRHASNMYFDAALLIALFGFVSASALAKFLLRGEVIE
jgi:multicomponent K+:H+ antiporter subunit F